MRRIVLVAILTLVFMTGCSKVYEIGEQCPAGGTIFYDKGVYAKGWRYMSVAHEETEFDASWSHEYFHVSGTSTAIGTGKQNTKLLIDVFNERGDEGTAAQLCAGLKTGRYSDWFLPSKDELTQMKSILQENGLGRFSNDWYWSSSQSDSELAWGRCFNKGHGSNYKCSTFKVRAVRAF